jgi:hypothetical protein
MIWTLSHHDEKTAIFVNTKGFDVGQAGIDDGFIPRIYGK